MMSAEWKVAISSDIIDMIHSTACAAFHAPTCNRNDRVIHLPVI